MKYSLLIIWIFFSFQLLGQSINSGKPYTEQQKIDFLILKVESLSNAKFVRNGTSYDAQTAAAHLKMKREKAGSSIKTVDDFIEKVASESSASGEPYTIEYSDGKKILAKQFYINCLKELETTTKPK